MSRQYRPGTSEYTAHGDGLAKAYNLGTRDVRARRARHRYNRTADQNRLRLQRELDALDRAREQELVELFRLAHRELRAATLRDGRPPKHFVFEYRGRILTSRDPGRVPRKAVAAVLARKMKAARRKNG